MDSGIKMPPEGLITIHSQQQLFYTTTLISVHIIYVHMYIQDDPQVLRRFLILNNF